MYHHLWLHGFVSTFVKCKLVSWKDWSYDMIDYSITLSIESVKSDNFCIRRFENFFTQTIRLAGKFSRYLLFLLLTNNTLTKLLIVILGKLNHFVSSTFHCTHKALAQKSFESTLVSYFRRLSEMMFSGNVIRIAWGKKTISTTQVFIAYTIG